MLQNYHVAKSFQVKALLLKTFRFNKLPWSVIYLDLLGWVRLSAILCASGSSEWVGVSGGAVFCFGLGIIALGRFTMLRFCWFRLVAVGAVAQGGTSLVWETHFGTEITFLTPPSGPLLEGAVTWTGVPWGTLWVGVLWLDDTNFYVEI